MHLRCVFLLSDTVTLTDDMWWTGYQRSRGLFGQGWHNAAMQAARMDNYPTWQRRRGRGKWPRRVFICRLAFQRHTHDYFLPTDLF